MKKYQNNLFCALSYNFIYDTIVLFDAFVYLKPEYRHQKSKKYAEA